MFAVNCPTPVIMVQGMGAEFYQNAGTEEASTVWPPAFEWADPSVDVAYHCDDSMANHPDYLDGTKMESTVVRALCEEIGVENVYLFTYDWRLDTLTHADSLHALIEKVKNDRALLVSPLYRRVWEHVSYPHIWIGMDRTICKTVFFYTSLRNSRE